METNALSWLLPPCPISPLSQGPRRRNDPAKNKAAISENLPQVTISKELEKVTFSIMAQRVGANIPLFLTTGPPATRSLLTSRLIDTAEEPQGEVLSC